MPFDIRMDNEQKWWSLYGFTANRGLATRYDTPEAARAAADTALLKNVTVTRTPVVADPGVATNYSPFSSSNIGRG